MATLSQRALITPPSPIRSLSPLAVAAEKRGTEILRLNIGQPDVESPESFFEGLRSFEKKVVAYETSEGSLELRGAWSEYMDQTLGISVSPDEMLITMGASEALVFTFWACCDPGDEVLILDPTYANYIGFAAVTGTKLVPVLTTLEDGFSLPPVQVLEEHITERTKAVLLCNPNNPTGTVYDKRELEAVLELCNRRGLFFVADETYREIVYDDRVPSSLFHIDDNNDCVVIVDSLSKRFSLCGARLGCIFTKNKEVLKKVLNMAQARLAAPTIEQSAAAYMLHHLRDDYFEVVRKTYESRRNVLAEALKSVPQVDFHVPHGAFYGIARLPVDDAVSFARFLLTDFSQDNTTVFLAPASGFYMGKHNGDQKARIAFVLEESKLRTAVSLISKALEQYPQS